MVPRMNLQNIYFHCWSQELPVLRDILCTRLAAETRLSPVRAL